MMVNPRAAATLADSEDGLISVELVHTVPHVSVRVELERTKLITNTLVRKEWSISRVFLMR
jgi:hypothetical protein